MGFKLAELIKLGIGLAAALPGWTLGLLPFCRSLRPSPAQRALWQLALLEAVVAIPGHVEALVSLLYGKAPTVIFCSLECFEKYVDE